MSRRLRRIAQLASVLFCLTGVLVFASAGTGAAQVAPVTNFAAYPPPLPAGCPQGAAALVNVRFTANGYTTATLYGVVAQPGDSIVMQWDGFVAGCSGVGVGFSSKLAETPDFQPSSTYWLYDFDYCGPEAGATPCPAGAGSLTLTVPPAMDVPCYQLDAHLGPPLSKVGPTGTYYGPLNGVQNMLVSAKNAGSGNCNDIPPCPTDPSIPAAALGCVPTTTTTTTSVPTSTVPPTSTSAPSATTTTSGSGVSPSTVATGAPDCPAGMVAQPGGRCAAASVLPATGRDSGSLALTGGLFLLSGLCFVFAHRRSALG
jgi:LPXTG-motif cell wall-anchored protein